MDINTISEIVARPQGHAQAWREGDAWLGGGTWLYSEPQPSLRRLIDLDGFGWTPLELTDDALVIAATCKIRELNDFEPPQDWASGPLIRQCCDALLGSFKIWQTATVGGNICLALPAGPMTALAAALDGVCTLWSPDATMTRRTVVDVVVAPGRTSLAPGQLLRSIRLPGSALRGRVAMRQISLATVGRSAALVIGRASVGEVVLTVTAATQRPVRLRYPAMPTVAAARADLDAAVGRWLDDVHGSPDWRRAMSLRLLGEVLEQLA